MQFGFYTLYEKLYDHYGPQGWWPSESDFETMIGAILVQNTNWKNVEKAIDRLRPYLDPWKMENLPTTVLAELIRSSGYYNLKAARIQSFLEWYKRYDYDVNQVKQLDPTILRSELLSVKGLGPETVDSLLVYVFDIPIFIVDAYTRRIFERLGYVMPKKYDDFRIVVEEELPLDTQVYNEFHALIVRHAKEHCTKKPICDGCPLKQQCRFVSVK